jgi:hypothetical protein
MTPTEIEHRRRFAFGSRALGKRVGAQPIRHALPGNFLLTVNTISMLTSSSCSLRGGPRRRPD